ncbi:MAG: site-specific integrase [Gemmatimonadetes bacterium]|nr:site-specific integrase [Gemmatimonadota bacterium]
MANATKKPWSYSTGEWGVNRVRAFERQGKGIFLEFRERNPDGTAGRKARVALGHSDRKAAKAKAEEVAAAFRREEPAQASEATLQVLFDTYGSEVTPEKGESKRKHDVRCAEMFLRYFGAQTLPRTLTRREWDRFVADRRRGAIAPAGVVQKRRVGERVITYDLKWLLSVFNWATTVGDGHGGFLLDRNPFKGLPLPRTESPQRSVLTHEQYLVLRGIAAQVAPQFDLALVLAHETGHRIGAIRQLRWSDIDLDAGTVHWRGELDKIGMEHTTLLTEEADAALRAERLPRPAIGDAWLFPAPGDPDQPASRHLVRDWWERAAKLADLAKGKRLGWHSLRRQWATEMKETPLKDLCYMGGWKSPMTVLTCYQQPDTETQREALARRKRYRAGAGG